jgi:hypothetical protein
LRRFATFYGVLYAEFQRFGGLNPRFATIRHGLQSMVRQDANSMGKLLRRFPAFSGVFSGPPNVSGVLGKVRRPGKTAPAELFTPPSRGIFHRIAPRSMRGKRAYKYVFPLNLSLSRTWQLKYKHLVLCDFNLLDF